MTWRAILAAGIFLALLVGGGLLLRRDESTQNQVTESRAAEDAPALAIPPPPLARAELIDAAARAADAVARGVPAPPDVAKLAGRRFILRLPFGCEGPAPPDSQAALRWSYDAEEQTLRAVVTSEVWTDAAFFRALVAGTEFEVAEGFWIQRPWMRAAECPRRTPPPAGRISEDGRAPEDGGTLGEPEAKPTPPALSAMRVQTLGIVELFEPGSRRAARRNGRPYTVVARIARGELDAAHGLRLVLEGRLVPLAGGRPIACRSEDPDWPPLCLIGAEIERVAITDASGERLLAEWGD